MTTRATGDAGSRTRTDEDSKMTTRATGDAGSTTRVYLVRHGSTAANRDVPYRLQGRGSDHPLDATGRSQALAAATALAKAPIVAVYTSPLRRARETACAIARASGLEPVELAALVEADLGRWEGLTWDEVKERYPQEFDRFMANPGTVPYLEGESFAEVRIRALGAIDRIVEAHRGRSVVVAAHNVVNRALLSGWLGSPIDRARSIRQANGGINLVEFEGDRATVVMMNSILHLLGIESH